MAVANVTRSLTRARFIPPPEFYTDNYARLTTVNKTQALMLSVYDADGRIVCLVPRSKDGDHAQLLAAAPKLAAALHRAWNLLALLPCGQRAMLQAEEALRAAGIATRDGVTIEGRVAP